VRDATLHAGDVAVHGASVAAAADGSHFAPEAAGTMLLVLGVSHPVMSAAATITSVYKPWGKTWIGRWSAASAMASPARVVAR